MVSSEIQSSVRWVNEHKDSILDGFKELLGTASISTDPAHKGELEACADWIISEMKRIGLNNCQKMPSAGHPVVYGEWLDAGEDRPTILIYAHYDVQPVDPLNLWESPPFEPEIRNGRLYARGAIDDKVGVWVNLKAIESILQTQGKLPVNVKIFFEGEEEMGSPSMQAFLSENKELLSADVLMLSDGFFDVDQPAMDYAMRGMVAAEVIIRGADHDLHSGVYGGAVHNPVHLVGKIIGSFHDDAGRIQIPGIYDRVVSLTDAEQDMLQHSWALTRDRHFAGSGVEKFWAESLATHPERVTALPTLDVNGVWGGYQGPGMKTVLPAQAGFKVTMRLVNDQDPAEIGQMLKDYIESFACDTLEIECNLLGSAWPFRLDITHSVIESVQKSFESVVGKRALITRGGGTLPIAGMFYRELGIPMVHLGFGAGDGAHSPNEYIVVDDFFTGIETAIHFLHNTSEIS